MKNKKYWEKRFIGIEKHTNSILKLSHKDIKNLSKKLKTELKKNHVYWFSKLMGTQKYNKAQAIKYITDEQRNEFLSELDEYIRLGEELSFTNEHIKELRAMSARYHIRREDVFKTHLRHFAELFYNGEHKIILDTFKDIYKESFFMSTYEIAKWLEAKVNLYHPNDKKLEILFSKPWTKDGIEFSERIWGVHRPKLVKKLYDALETSLIRGDNPINMAEKLAKAFETAENRARVLLHTEGAYIAERAREECFNRLDIDKYIIVATLDMKTSDICRHMDGEIFEVKKKEVGVNAPPFHPNCRTTTAPYFEELKGKSYRAARDKEGKAITVPNDMTYEQFHKKYVESDPEYSFKEKAWRNRHSDRKQFEKYKKLGFDEIKSFDKFQDMKYNDIKEWNMVKGYGKSVQNGEISPLIKYSNFKEQHNDLKNNLVGLKFGDGTEIKDISYHFTARAIGTHDWANPKNSKETMKRLNHKHVPTKDIIDCIEKGKVLYKRDKSFTYSLMGICNVTINPSDGILVQCNPRRGG